MFIRVLLLAVIALAVVGCQATDPAARAAAHAAQCQQFGFRPGTDNFAACRLRLEEGAKQEFAESRRRIGNALLAASVMSQPPRQTVTNCSQTPWGAITCTTH